MKKMNNILYLTTLGVISSITPTHSNAQTFYQCLPTVCPAGQYKNTSGNCISCPKGTYNSESGQISKDACKECKEEYSYTSSEGMTECKTFSNYNVNVFYGVGAKYLTTNYLGKTRTYCGNGNSQVSCDAKYATEYWCDNTIFAKSYWDGTVNDPASGQKKYCGLSINLNNFGGCNSKTAITGGGCMNSTYYFASENSRYYVKQFSKDTGGIYIKGDKGAFIVYPDGTIEIYDNCKYNPGDCK